MATQLFLNNFTTVFIAPVKQTPTTGTPATELDYGVLRVSDGAAGMLLNPTGGDYYVLTAYKRSGSTESNIEVMRVTAVDNSTPGECRITVQRAQEGTTAQAYVSGDYLSLRFTKGSAENMVQKVAGKGLSTEDYTTTEKSKLAGVAAGATANSTDAQLRDRATHTGTQAISTVSGLQAALDTKVDKVAGKGLSTEDYTTAEKNKLAGIAAGANNYTHPTGDGNQHVPATGTTNNGKVLKAGSTAGSAAWGNVDYSEVTNRPTLGTAASKDVAATGNASTAQVVLGTDTRLSDSRPASDVSAWAKAATKPTYTKSEVGLGNVDNTSDANKPISTATQTALDAKAPTATPTITGLREVRAALPANNIDLALGNVFTKTISGATTLTVSNVPAAGVSASFILKLTNGGSAGVTWWAGVKWPGGTPPTLTVSGRDNIYFQTDDGGTTWDAAIIKDVK